MKINWKRVVIAAIVSQLLLVIIYVPLELNDFQVARIVGLVSMPVLLFLGGFWVVRESDSRFFLHGLLTGFFANIVWYFVAPLVRPDQSLWNGIFDLIILLLNPTNILAGGLGGYVGGRRRKETLSTQDSKASS